MREITHRYLRSTTDVTELPLETIIRAISSFPPGFVETVAKLPL